MNYALNWSAEMLHINIAILIVTLGFMAYYFLEHSKKLYQQFKTAKGEEYAQMRMVFLHHWSGAIAYGVVPIIIYFFILKVSPTDFGFRGLTVKGLYWLIPLSLVGITLSWFSAATPNGLKMYPAIRKKVWSRQLVAKSAIGWATYLTAYEIMFRGFLLFACVAAFDVWTAFVINAAFNALTHIHKGFKEAILSMPMSTLFCYMTLESGTLLVPILVHIALSLSNEWFSLRNHPDIQVIQKPVA